MIDQQLINSAKNIRKEFLSLSSNLNKYQDDVKKLSDFLTNKINELTRYNDEYIKKIKTKDDLSKSTLYVLNSIQEIEDEEKKLTKRVEDVNKKLEKLKLDEVNLYETIKKRYPDLDDDKIVSEIHKHLDK